MRVPAVPPARRVPPGLGHPGHVCTHKSGSSEEAGAGLQSRQPPGPREGDGMLARVGGTGGQG